jgi:hypothetical protein
MEFQPRKQVRNGPVEPKPAQTLVPRGDNAATVPNQLPPVASETKSETNKAQVKAAITEGDFYYENGEYEKALGTYLGGLQKAPGNLMLQQRLKRAQKAFDTERSILSH